jgi:hypothetical protein
MAGDQVINTFVVEYLSDVVLSFQRFGPALADTVQRKDGVIGKTAEFYKVGQGEATSKTRHGYVPPMNISQTPITVTLEDFYAGDYLDKLDEPKTKTNQRLIKARAGVHALGRKVDSQILTALATTTQAAQTWVFTSSGTILQSYLETITALQNNNAFQKGEVYMILNPKAFNALATVPQFASADWVDAGGRRFVQGTSQLDGLPMNKWKDWDGVMVSSFTGLPSGTTGYMWNRNAVGYATQQLDSNLAQATGFTVDDTGMIGADVTWIGDRAAWFINHWMSGGSTMIDDPGVLKIAGSAAIPTA